MYNLQFHRLSLNAANHEHLALRIRKSPPLFESSNDGLNGNRCAVKCIEILKWKKLIECKLWCLRKAHLAQKLNTCKHLFMIFRLGCCRSAFYSINFIAVSNYSIRSILFVANVVRNSIAWFKRSPPSTMFTICCHIARPNRFHCMNESIIYKLNAKRKVHERTRDSMLAVLHLKHLDSNCMNIELAWSCWFCSLLNSGILFIVWMHSFVGTW